jgi:hypothetical protein
VQKLKVGIEDNVALAPMLECSVDLLGVLI